VRIDAAPSAAYKAGTGQRLQENAMRKVIATVCMGLLLGIGAANAAEKKKSEAKPRTAKSIECSKQADAKGLKGKDRRAFRAKCKKGES
jgi:hypothetical protein